MENQKRKNSVTASCYLLPASCYLPPASCLLLIFLLLISACKSNLANPGSLRLSGSIEGTRVAVVSEISGRVVELAADEGDTVRAGQVLVRLDDSTLQVQMKQAQAALKAAQANLAQVKAGARQEEIAAAQAVLAQAQAERDGAELACTDASAILENPQQLLAQLDAARTAAQLAGQAVPIAQARLDEARWWRDFYEDDPGRHESLDKQIAIAQHDLEAAQAQWSGANAQVRALEAMRRAPVTLQAQVNTARNTYSMTLASVSVAESALAELKAGPSAQEIALAEAQVHQAQAQLKLAQAQLTRAALQAPLGGIISSRSAQVGETVQAGVALLTITNLDKVTLVVYVPQQQLPRVQLGMPVQVYVDVYPDEAFDGQVTFIASQAQFAARDTQAREDRVNVVFAVKVSLPNPQRRLKAGMTAEAVIDVD